MKIEEIFATRIHERINPVIKVSDRSNEVELAGEIDGYVVTDVIEQVIDDYLEHYTDTWLKDTKEVGVWISGYFGSGKSHLAKILALLSENRLINNTLVSDRFKTRLIPLSNSEEDIKRIRRIKNNLEIISNGDTEVFAFNINSLISANHQDLPTLLLSQFYEAKGYCSHLHFAKVIESTLDSKGKLEELHIKIEELTGENWEEIKTTPTFYMNQFFQAASIVAPDQFTSAEQVHESVNSDMKGVLVNVNSLVSLFMDYLEKKKQKCNGKPQRLLWVFDEAGQWIEGDINRLSVLQAFVEELDSKTKGKVMLILTTHADMESIYREAGRIDKDFKRMAERFWLRPMLTTENIELVLENRLLRKNAEGTETLKDLYSLNSGSIRNTGQLINTSQVLPPCTEPDYIKYYPFFPYQIHLIPEIVKTIRAKGGMGDQMSGSTRTLLGIVQDVLQNGVRSYLTLPTGTMVSLNEVYSNLKNEGEINPDIARELSKIPSITGGTLRTMHVAEVLYLIQEIKFIPRTMDNISRLVIPDVSTDLTSFMHEIEGELELLEKSSLISKIGLEYEYLTQNKRNLEKDITAYQIKLLRDDKERGIKDNFFENDGESSRIEWIGNNFVEYNGISIKYSLTIDEKKIETKGDISLTVFTPLSLYRLEERDILAESTRAENATTIYLISGNILTLDEDLCRFLATSHVTGEWQRDVHKSEEDKNLARSRADTDIEVLRKIVITDLLQGIEKGYFIYKGNRIPIHSIQSKVSPKDKLKELILKKIPEIYHKIDQAPSSVTQEGDAIEKVLKGKGHSHADVKRLKILDSGGNLDSHAPLIDAVRVVLISRQNNGVKTLGSDIISIFQGPPYGWNVNAVRVAIAAMIRAGIVSIEAGGKPLYNPESDELQKKIKDSNQFKQVELKIQIGPDPDMLTRLRSLLIRISGRKDIDETPSAISSVAEEIQSKLQDKAQRVQDWSAGSGLPLSSAFLEGVDTWEKVIALKNPSHRLQNMDLSTSVLEEGAQAVDNYFSFMERHKGDYSVISQFVSEVRSLSNYFKSGSKISNLISLYDTANENKSVISPEIWNALYQAYNESTIELTDLIEHTRSEIIKELSAYESDLADNPLSHPEWGTNLKDSIQTLKETVEDEDKALPLFTYKTKTEQYYLTIQTYRNKEQLLLKSDSMKDDITNSPVPNPETQKELLDTISGIISSLQTEESPKKVADFERKIDALEERIRKARVVVPVLGVNERQTKKIKIVDLLPKKNLTNIQDWNTVKEELNKKILSELNTFNLELE